MSISAQGQQRSLSGTVLLQTTGRLTGVVSWASGHRAADQ